MKQRLGLATTVISEPQLMLLDEPCSALDPLGRREVMDLISSFKGKSTVLISTHILSDIESICDSVTILNYGRTLFSGSIDGIARSERESFEDAVLNLLKHDTHIPSVGK
jgi:ABC-2 type transport system ATP-binding protein